MQICYCMYPVSESLISLLKMPNTSHFINPLGGRFGVRSGRGGEVDADNQGIIAKIFNWYTIPVLCRLSCKESMIYKQISLLFSSHPVKKYWPRQCIYLRNPTQIAAYVKLQLYRDLGRWKSFVYAPLFEGFVKKKTFMIVAVDNFEKIFWQTQKSTKKFSDNNNFQWHNLMTT